MLIQFLFYLMVLLVAFYYLTIFLHGVGILSLSKKKVNFKKSFIPFYYWWKILN